MTRFVKSETVHFVGDDRPNGRAREVYLNGRRMRKVIYADTKKGRVIVYDDPPKVHKHKKRAIRRTYRGKVEVLWPNTN